MPGRRIDAHLDRVAGDASFDARKVRTLELRRLAREHPAAASRGSFDQHREPTPDELAIACPLDLFLHRDKRREPAPLNVVADRVAELMRARVLTHRILEHE